MISWKQKILLILVTVVIVVIGSLILALQVKSCQHDAEVEALQAQILESTNYAVEKVDENTSAIKTVKTNKSISRKELSEELARNTKKMTIAYDAKIQTVLKEVKKVQGKSKPTKIVTHHKEKEIIISDPKIREQCNECLAQVKVKVPFEVNEGPWKISGHTLSGTALGEPGEFELSLELHKKIALEIVLAQTKKGSWETFLYSKDLDVKQIQSKLSVKPWRPKWYEKFMFPANILVSKDLHFSLGGGIYYQFLNNVAFGIDARVLFLNHQQKEWGALFGVGVIITTNRKKF